MFNEIYSISLWEASLTPHCLESILNSDNLAWAGHILILKSPSIWCDSSRLTAIPSHALSPVYFAAHLHRSWRFWKNLSVEAQNRIDEERFDCTGQKASTFSIAN